MKHKRLMVSIILVVMLVGIAFVAGCLGDSSPPKSDSGVSKATVRIQTGADGLTVEQRNIKDRLEHDNRPGAIEYMYIISSYSGQVIYNDVVKGKVTSSGKRLTPFTVSGRPDNSWCNAIDVNIGGRNYCTAEVLQDDGSYGSSMEYLYYWDTKGIYHQIYISGGQLVVESDQPIGFKGIIINVENVNSS